MQDSVFMLFLWSFDRYCFSALHLISPVSIWVKSLCMCNKMKMNLGTKAPITGHYGPKANSRNEIIFLRKFSHFHLYINASRITKLHIRKEKINRFSRNVSVTLMRIRH